MKDKSFDPARGLRVLAAALLLAACTPEGLTRAQYDEIKRYCRENTESDVRDRHAVRDQLATSDCVRRGVERARAGSDPRPVVVPVEGTAAPAS